MNVDRINCRQPGWVARLLLLLSFVIVSTPSLAHGVSHRIEHREAVIVHFFSDHAGPMADAGFRVFAPDGGRVFVHGRTDALGRAVFVPNAAGEWRVLMATEDGHGAEIAVPVESISAAARGEDPSGPMVGTAGTGRLPALAAGVGYLFGLGGLFLLLRRRD